MSDRDRATPGRPSAPGAAPWERWRAQSRPEAAPGSGDYDEAGTAQRVATIPRRSASGNHTGGISVADLIAKVGADLGSGRHRAAPAGDEPQEPREPQRFQEPPERREPRATAEPDTWSADHIAGVALPSELPDLDRIYPPASDDEAEPVRTARRRPRRPQRPQRPKSLRRPAKAKPRKTIAAPTRRRALLAGRLIAGLMAVLALALTGGAWQWSTSKNNSLNRISALDLNSGDIVDPGGQYGDENFLIVGADTRAGANSGVGAGDADDAGGARSDTIMLVNIPASRKRVVVVSFPRDLAITPIRCEAWNPDTGAYGPLYDEDTGTWGDDIVYTETKLNSTYAFGGPKCLVKEIQKLSGLSINRFMAVDFVGFGKMVDALGGVEVCTSSPLYDYELGWVLDQTGRQTVDGATALSYVRARNVTTETNGDYGRIKRQQLFLSSLLRSLISKNTLFSLPKLNNVVNMFISDSYVDNIKTRDLVSLGQSLQGMSAGHITFVTVPTGDTDENGDEPPRTADMRALFDAIINDDPLPGENDTNATSTLPTTTTSSSTGSSTTSTTSSASPGTTSGTQATTPSATAQQHRSQQVRTVTTAPGEVSVRVSNGTEQSGLAASASDQLELRGFNVISTDDYTGPTKPTTVLFSPGNEQAAATVAAALGNAPLERVTGMGDVVRVVLGSDFRAVGIPAPSGSPVTVQLTRGASTAPTRLPDDLTLTNAADITCE